AGLGPRQEGGIGHPTNQARASDGAVPPPSAGPGFAPVPVTPEFSAEREAEREAARRSVAEAGQDPDAVEAQAGPRAREFPTTAADWEPQQPGQADGSTQPELRDDAGEGDRDEEQE